MSKKAHSVWHEIHFSNVYQPLMEKRAQNPLSFAFSVSYCELVEQLPYKNNGKTNNKDFIYQKVKSGVTTPV
ncbi:hypothetical protein WJ596_002769 [Escherichia coli]